MHIMHSPAITWPATLEAPLPECVGTVGVAESETEVSETGLSNTVVGGFK